MQKISEIIKSLLRDAKAFDAREVYELGRRLDNIDGQADVTTQMIGVNGAPTNAPYVTIANTPALSAERALIVDGSLSLVDSGANGTATLSIKSGGHNIISAHSASGLTAGHVLRASSATVFAFAALQASDMTPILSAAQTYEGEIVIHNGEIVWSV
jgi:hypothetical protein